MKKFCTLVLCGAMLLSLMAGCVSSGTRPDDSSVSTDTASPSASVEFTDDCGRTVTIPSEITRLAVTGPLTQMYILPLCPEKLVGFSRTDAAEQAFLSQQLAGLPELGQLYGGKGTMDLEALLASGAQIVIDGGESKESMADDLDRLTEQTGIPFVHIEATVASSAESYRKLGDLLNCKPQADRLADYCQRTLDEVRAIMEQVDADGARKTVLYCLGDKGVNVLAEKSFHAETLSLVAKNVAELDNVVSKGTGNEVDLEQIILWNPEVLLFAPDSCYEQVLTDPSWQEMQALKAGTVYKTPIGPYGWLASPPSIQRFLGMQWLCALLYPEYVGYDLQDRVTEYYDLFYGYALDDAAYQEIVKNAL